MQRSKITINTLPGFLTFLAISHILQAASFVGGNLLLKEMQNSQFDVKHKNPVL